MTVAELIEELQQLPADAEVVIDLGQEDLKASREPTVALQAGMVIL